AASIALMRPWPMSSSRAWLSPMVLKATLSSRAPAGRRSRALRMPALFQCSSMAMIFTVVSFSGRQERTACALPADGLTLVVQVLQATLARLGLDCVDHARDALVDRQRRAGAAEAGL